MVRLPGDPIPALHPAFRCDLLVSVGPFLLLAVLMLGGAGIGGSTPTRPKPCAWPPDRHKAPYANFWAARQGLAKDGISDATCGHPVRRQLRLLREGAVDLGFVRGGTADRQSWRCQPRVPWGSLFLSPVWLFYREAVAPADTTPPQTLDSLTQPGACA